MGCRSERASDVASALALYPSHVCKRGFIFCCFMQRESVTTVIGNRLASRLPIVGCRLFCPCLQFTRACPQPIVRGIWLQAPACQQLTRACQPITVVTPLAACRQVPGGWWHAPGGLQARPWVGCWHVCLQPHSNQPHSNDYCHSGLLARVPAAKHHTQWAAGTRACSQVPRTVGCWHVLGYLLARVPAAKRHAQ